MLGRPSLACALLAVTAGCDRAAMFAPGPQPPEEVTVRVYGDPDEPVANVEIGSGQGTLARTDATGAARFMLDGQDGTRYELPITCPTGYTSPSRPLKVV